MRKDERTFYYIRTNPQPRYGFYNLKGSQKLCVFTSTYLLTQEVLEYPLEYASFYYTQMLYHNSLASSKVVFGSFTI